MKIPSAADVRARLAHLSIDEMQAIGAAAGVPWRTIHKIKTGLTANPGIDTVRGFIDKVPRPRPRRQAVA
jgi:hypothetical protein